MNWIELRPILREQFGHTFHFYNDKYKSGNRRVKIRCYSMGDKRKQEMYDLIKNLDVNIDVNFYKNHNITIHYKK
jgi:hypothetical protein